MASIPMKLQVPALAAAKTRTSPFFIEDLIGSSCAARDGRTKRLYAVRRRELVVCHVAAERDVAVAPHRRAGRSSIGWLVAHANDEPMSVGMAATNVKRRTMSISTFSYD